MPIVLEATDDAIYTEFLCQGIFPSPSAQGRNASSQAQGSVEPERMAAPCPAARICYQLLRLLFVPGFTLPEMNSSHLSKDLFEQPGADPALTWSAQLSTALMSIA